MGFTKIENSDLTGIGVIGLPDQPGLSTGAMQSKFEETSRSVIIPKHNALIDELEDTTSAASLGATPLTNRASSPNVQAVMEKLSTDLKTVEDGMAEAIADAHTHDNKELLDTYSQTEANLADAVSKKHEHLNKSLLDTYSQTEANLADAVSKKHEHSNKSLLDSYTQTEANLANAVSNTHSHSNKALLDTYTQTEANLADAVSKKHSHSNKTVIDKFGEDSGGNPTYDGNPIGGGGIAYDKVKVGTTTLQAASGATTLELKAGANVTLTPNASDNSVLVAASGGGSSTGDMLMADYDADGDVKNASSDGNGIKDYVASAISGKQDTMSAGTGIDITGTTISLDMSLLTGSNLSYDNTTSGLTATNAQDAIDELVDDINTKAPLTLLDDTVGWDCRNKLVLKDPDFSWQGITAELTADGKGIKVNGTAGQNLGIWITNPIAITAGRYKLTCDGYSAWGDDFTIQLYRIDGANEYASPTIYINSTDEADLIDGNYHARISIASGKSISNVSLYPMLCDASLPSSSFVPPHLPVSSWGYTREEAEYYGAKNMFPLLFSAVKGINTSGTWNNNVYTLNNVTATFTVDSAGYINAIDVDGTANALVQIQLKARSDGNDYLTAGQRYVLNGCPDGGGNNTYSLNGFCTKSGAYYSYGKDIGDGLSFVADNSTFGASIDVINGTSLSHKIFKPMLSLTGGAYKPFALPNRELTEKFDAKSVKSVLTSSNMTIDEAYFTRSGCICAYSLKLTASSDIAANTVIITDGLVVPNPMYDMIANGKFKDTNGTEYSISFISSSGVTKLYSSTAIANGKSIRGTIVFISSSYA